MRTSSGASAASVPSRTSMIVAAARNGVASSRPMSPGPAAPSSLEGGSATLVRLPGPPAPKVRGRVTFAQSVRLDTREGRRPHSAPLVYADRHDVGCSGTSHDARDRGKESTMAADDSNTKPQRTAADKEKSRQQSRAVSGKEAARNVGQSGKNRSSSTQVPAKKSGSG